MTSKPSIALSFYLSLMYIYDIPLQKLKNINHNFFYSELLHINQKVIQPR